MAPQQVGVAACGSGDEPKGEVTNGELLVSPTPTQAGLARLLAIALDAATEAGQGNATIGDITLEAAQLVGTTGLAPCAAPKLTCDGRPSVPIIRERTSIMSFVVGCKALLKFKALVRLRSQFSWQTHRGAEKPGQS